MDRIFVAAWEYPPKMSGESVVCKRTLENSEFSYDVCCGGLLQENNISKSYDKIQVISLTGRYICWPFNVARKFLQLNKQRNYKVMMSRVMPANGHLAGLLIKLIKPKIKWVVYFSDPIWNSPFISFPSLFRKNLQQQPNYLLMKLFGIPAYIAIMLGDLLVFNNERLARYVLSKNYNRYKTKVVITPYGHERIEIQERVEHKKETDRITITHVGQIYGARSFSILLKSLEILKENNTEEYKKIQIVQVGFICAKEKQIIINSGVSDRFKLVNEVSYEDSLDYMRYTDYALILDPYFNDARKNIYVPVKIYDYMSVGARILAIADLNSATADIIKQIGCPMASHDIEEISKLLLSCIENKHVDYTKRYRNFNCKQGIDYLDKKLAALLRE